MKRLTGNIFKLSKHTGLVFLGAVFVFSILGSLFVNFGPSDSSVAYAASSRSIKPCQKILADGASVPTDPDDIPVDNNTHMEDCREGYDKGYANPDQNDYLIACPAS